ncbi:EAL domain-containing protein [Sulfurimonas sp. SAG-AH-194-I05]|nr:EAL domain-containing protein [Sulfurimonas sp. SAG-AH-194-I05]MDF1874744.1 EAL domain-containing protein [Sulfurimonas sp. SAG-AH-194-I05]
MNYKIQALKVLLKIIFIIAIIEFMLMQVLVLLDGYFNSWQEILLDTLFLSILSAPLLYKYIIYPFIKKEEQIRKQLWETNAIFSAHVIASKSDLKGVITYVSEALCKVSGYSKGELIGKPHSILRHPDMPASLFENLWQTVQKGSPWKGKIKNKKKDGGYYWVETDIIPARDKDENIVGYNSIRRDITDEIKYAQRGKILENSLNEIYIFDARTYKFLYINRGAEKNIGYTYEEMKDMTPLDIKPRLTKEDFIQLIAPLNEEEHISFSTLHQRKDKTFYNVDIYLQKTMCKDHHSYVAIILDVSKRVKAEEELNANLTILHKLTQNVPGALYQYKLQPDGTASFPYASDNIYDVYEVTPQDVRTNAQRVFDNLHHEDVDMIVASIEKSAKTMQAWTLEYRVDLPMKGVRWLEGHSQPEKLEDGSILWHGYIHDITQRKESEQLLLKQQKILLHQAHFDALTGLPNRTLLNDRLEKAMKKANRNTTKIAVLFVDLDHFKEINDSLGHNVGDLVLQAITTRLKDLVRVEDTISRLGGDEFTILLEDLRDAKDATGISSKILEGLSLPLLIDEHELYVSSSIGISIYPDDGVDKQSLIKFADSAMYKAKEEGRNNFQFYDSKLTELAYERVIMEASLRTAIKNNEFVVYYQPQVDGRDHTLVGMEALVRWNHPTMGMIAPFKFIPLAETTGLIVALDRIVMEQAMTQVAQWYKDGLNPGKLAINLAVKQLQTTDCLEVLEKVLKKNGFKTQWLELEVTESQIMSHPEEAIKKLQTISDLGISLSVDDFGTGYSSLAYLKRLPINKLKIDREFIKDLPGNEEDCGITKAIIALSQSLNLRVIAEGVETKEQRDFVVENGCNNIQGYYYSKPIPASALEVILKNGLVQHE